MKADKAIRSSSRSEEVRMARIIVICAWCRKFLRVKDGKGESGISHGICKECAEKTMAKYKKK